MTDSARHPDRPTADRRVAAFRDWSQGGGRGDAEWTITRSEVDMNGEYVTTKDIGASRFKAEVDRIARDVLNPGDAE